MGLLLSCELKNNKDENVHRFALSAIRGKLLKRERETEKERKREERDRKERGKREERERKKRGKREERESKKRVKRDK